MDELRGGIVSDYRHYSYGDDMKKLIMIGAGGHAKSVFDSLDKEQYELVGFIDSNKVGTHLGLPILGSRIEDVTDFESFSYFVSIGDVYFRKLWFNRLIGMNLPIINIIDRTAIISPDAKIGIGNFFGKLSIVNSDVVIGNDNIINTKALIEHECRIGNHNHISTNATVNGAVVMQDCVFFGSAAVVSNGQIEIGHDSIIGAGSVVIHDVEPLTTVVGVPARVIKRRDSNG